MLAVRGHNIKRAHDFEHTRALVYSNYAINRDPKKAFPSIEKFWPLPTDGDTAAEEQSEGDRLYQKLQKFKKENLHK